MTCFATSGSQARPCCALSKPWVNAGLKVEVEQSLHGVVVVVELLHQAHSLLLACISAQHHLNLSFHYVSVIASPVQVFPWQLESRWVVFKRSPNSSGLTPKASTLDGSFSLQLAIFYYFGLHNAVKYMKSRSKQYICKPAT